LMPSAEVIMSLAFWSIDRPQALAKAWNHV